jgi:large subunit ribosomal protein L29
MAILRTKDITNMALKEQQAKLEDLKKELMKLQSQMAMGSLPESPGRVKELKRTIARLLTIQRRTIQKQ